MGIIVFKVMKEDGYFVSSHAVIQTTFLMSTSPILACKVAVVITSHITLLTLFATNEAMGCIFEIF